MEMHSFAVLLFICLAVERTVGGPLSQSYVHNVHMRPIHSTGGANISAEQHFSAPPSLKITLAHKLSTHSKITLTSKAAKARRNANAVVTSAEQMVLAEEVPEVVPDEVVPDFALPAHRHENSLGQYLAALSNYYLSAGLSVPPRTIARVLLRMHNALPPSMVMPLPYPLTLENFRVDTNPNDFGGMSGDVRISFIAECKICSKSELTTRKLLAMSPQQISEMRLSSDQSDIAWFLGSVAHLLVFQSYPLEEWARRNNILPDNCQFGEDLDNFRNSESFCILLVQKSVNKMLDSEEKLQIRSDFPRGWEKQWPVLGRIMKHALQAASAVRTFDENGHLLKMSSLMH